VTDDRITEPDIERMKRGYEPFSLGDFVVNTTDEGEARAAAGPA
jgi:hypothetical protein